MRPRFVIFFLVLLAAIFALVFWRKPIQRVTAPAVPQTFVQSTNSPAGKAGVTIQDFSNAPPPAALSTNQRSSVAVDPRSPESVKKYIESQNVPVEFYGKVIDQGSNALAGADIKALVRHWTMPDPAVPLAGSKEIPLEQTSGSDGRFELTGATGDGFGIGITKGGYEAEPSHRSFGPVGSSHDDPVIFKMWSTNIHEHLVGGKKAFHIIPDGRLYFINLTDGTISESGAGDLKVWVKRPEPITSRRYDWSCGMEAINGGILQESDKNAAMYEAPKDGYTTSFGYEESASANGWGDTTGEQRFYVKLNNGQEFGRLSIELEAYYNNQIPAMIRLSYAINPSGSRILR